MKKTLTIITLLAGAVSGYSQGEIVFNAYGTFKQAVYGTQLTSAYAVSYGGFTVLETVGSSPTTVSSAENPAVTTPYAAGSGLSGTGYHTELLVGPGGLATAGATASGVGLTPYGGSASATAVPYGFFTGNARHIGFINATASFTLPNQSYFAGGSTVSVAIAAWNNKGGADATLTAAQQDPTGQWGISQVVQMSGIPASPAPPQNIPSTLESFSLGQNVAVVTPEPSTIALGVMGASALLFRRRK